MTVETTNSTISYTGNGSVTTFAYNFLTYSEDHLFIYLDDVEQTSGYSVSGVGDESGGDVTFDVAPISGEVVRIDRTVPETQLIEYQEYGPFPAKTNERGLDLGVMIAQQNAREIGRDSSKKMDKQPLAMEDNIVTFDDEGNSKDSGVNLDNSGVITDLNKVIPFETLNEAVSETNPLKIFDGAALNIKERTAGNGGGAMWDVVDIGAVTPNGFNIVAHDSLPLALVLRIQDMYNVKQFGATGDNSTDDTLAIQATLAAADAGDQRATAYFPFGHYIVSDTLTVTCHSKADPGAEIHPLNMPANAAVYDITARTNHHNISIVGGGTPDVNNGTIGIQVKGTGISSSRVQLNQCKSTLCFYGMVIATFSVMIINCTTNNNARNISMYAPATNQEINDINVIGGNHSNPTGSYAIWIGDPNFTTSIPVGDPHGNSILLQGFAVDGGTIRVQSMFNTMIQQVYFEASSSGKGIELGSSGLSGSASLVTIDGCHFRSMDYGIFCYSAVRALDVRPCNYSGITTCALYIESDLYPYSYKAGTVTGSFAKGVEVHTGARSGLTSNFWAESTIDVYGLDNGVATGTRSNHIYPNQHEKYQHTTFKYNTLRFRYYKDNLVSATGTVSGTTFTADNPADLAGFNGGDALEADIGDAVNTYITKIDYEAGTFSMSAPPSPGAGITMSQETQTYKLETYGQSVPTETKAADGSIQWNTFNSFGTPLLWKKIGGAWQSGPS